MATDITPPDPAVVLDLIEAFRRSKSMFTAVSLGVFDALVVRGRNNSRVARFAYVVFRTDCLAARRRKNSVNFLRSNFQLKGCGWRLLSSSYRWRRDSTSWRLAKSLGVRTFL